MINKVQITELALRDGHQSLLATRMRLDDMLPIAEKLDSVGYWSIESWGGATFDSCIRFLGEDPWVRIRELKKAMPKTRQQMLLRGQNILGYRNYADDVVSCFVERAYANGVEVFRIFDALNDTRNLKTSITATKKCGGHAQGTLSYTESPIHNQQYWLDLAREQEDMGIDSLAIKDMSGLLRPMVAFDLITALKKHTNIPIHLHCHATTGLSTATFVKAVEAGVDVLDTAISSLSQTYSHSATETIVAMLEDTPRDTGLDIHLLETIGIYFREVRKKYAKFEGTLKGIDSRILIAQVPGGMLTNLESQLKQQNALDKMDEVIAEIPKVREDLGYIPLVTPASQITGTQAVLNVLNGRYSTLSRETQALIRGEYGKTPGPINEQLKRKVLGDEQPIKHRPADDLQPELSALTEELQKKATEENFSLAENIQEDALTYALFPQPALYFFQNRNDSNAFEKIESSTEPTKITPIDNSSASTYTVKVDGALFEVEVQSGTHKAVATEKPATVQADSTAETTVTAPMTGNITAIQCAIGDKVVSGDTLFILEAMKMETEIKAVQSGTVSAIGVQPGVQVKSGDTLARLA